MGKPPGFPQITTTIRGSSVQTRPSALVIWLLLSSARLPDLTFSPLVRSKTEARMLQMTSNSGELAMCKSPHEVLAATPTSLKRTADTEQANNSSTAELNTGNYPKKRASIACDTCRSRKTKCDGARPRCSFCKDLDIDCLYRRPLMSSRDQARHQDTSVGDAICRVEEHLHRIESLVVDVLSQVPQFNNANKADREYEIASAIGPVADMRGLDYSYGTWPASDQQDNSPSIPIPDQGSVSSASRIFRTEWPDLETFESLPPLNSIQYDDTKEHTAREIRRGEGFADIPSDLSSLDLSPRTIRRYQQYFARNILSWVSLFDHSFMEAQIEKACQSGFAQDNLHTALAALIFALGAISNDDENTSDDPQSFAGIQYFAYGAKISSQMNTYGPSILSIQCQILSSIYYLYTTRQLQAWRLITQASSDVPMLFKANLHVASDEETHQSVIRAFWACYIIEYELSGKLSGHLVSLSELLETMQLPSSDYEDLGSYFFSSAIALRKLICRVMALVQYSGTGSGTVFAPVIAFELHKQLEAWYAHLVPMLKFPLGDSLVLDPHKAFLRAQYFSILAVTKWTFVLRMIDTDQSDHISYDTLINHGRQCVESAISYISTLESLMSSRHLMLAVHLKGLYTMTVMLLSIHNVRLLGPIMVPGIEQAIKKTVEMMHIWSDNPSVLAAIERLEDIMINLGIPLDRL